MTFLVTLWLPVLLAAVFVFVASSILHMVIPVHAGDYARLPAEDEIRKALRGHGVGRGQYMFPCPASMKEMGSPEMVARFNEGPNGYLVVGPSGPPAIGKSLVQWFAYSILIGVLVAYGTYHALGPGAGYLAVFRVSGTMAILGYSLGYIPDSIWKGLSWRVTLKFVCDGVVYGLLTAGTFGWLWPRG